MSWHFSGSRYLWSQVITVILLSHIAMAQQSALAKSASTNGTLAKIMLGQGEGHMEIQGKGAYVLHASVKKLGDYSENWKMTAAIFDYYLPKPIPLTKAMTHLSLSFLNPYITNKKHKPMLRVLIGDQRGHVFAVGTRLGARRSTLSFTDHFRVLQTYDWNINEMGRVDPWVIMRVTPDELDFYDRPQGTVRFVGFRLVLRGVDDKNICQVTVREVLPLTANEKADPYWQLTADQQWQRHFAKRGDYNTKRYGRYGWGPSEPGPYLKVSDLRLRGGESSVSWELLKANDWTVLASSQKTLDLKQDSVIQMPLLETGTYRLKLCVIRGKEQAQNRFLQYVVLRNNRGPQPQLPKQKPLVIESSTQSNIFNDPDHASVTLATTQSGQLRWSLTTSDRQPIAKGESARIDLSRPFRQHPVLWLKAQLVRDGKVIDELHRILGLRSPAPVAAVNEGPMTPKVKRLAGKLRRTKGDWFEGGTPIASQSTELLAAFSAWMDDAVDVGYNIVGLPAPWYDLNPLPNVYQFEYLDKLLALAQSRGLMVMLRIHPRLLLAPGYVPRQLMMDQTGFAHGLWNGGNKLLSSPASEPYRIASNAYITALASRYRNHPAMLGYSFESLYFDHDMLDMPWLGQSIDYSQTMRRGFVKWLKNRYGNLASLNEKYETEYVHWEQISPPYVQVMFDHDGRPMPHQTQDIRDWMDYKVHAISTLRIGWLKAAKQADPQAFLGSYYTASVDLYLDALMEVCDVITYGSMEGQYLPQTRKGIPARFEPHGKIARAAILIDIGLTNLLMVDQIGIHGFFNYWMPQWRVKDQPRPVKEAEARLKTWFKFIDQLANTKPVAESVKKKGAYVISNETLLYEFGHVFTPRIDDYLKPFVFHLGESGIRATLLHAKEVDAASLQGRPWVYLPYVSDMISESLVKTLKAYVQQGGTLIMEAGSGQWSTDHNQSDGLSKALGLGHWQTHKANVARGVTSGGGWQGVEVKLLTQPWNPPINDQLTPWIHNIAAGYLQLGTWSKLNAEAGAIVTSHPLGKGEVLAIGGVVNWLASPGLIKAIEQFIAGQQATDAADAETAKAGEVQILQQQLKHAAVNFLVGRRFMPQNEIEKVKAMHSSGLSKEVDQVPVLCHLKLVELKTSVNYRITDLLDGRHITPQSGASIMADGITISLKPGQAFVLKVEQE